MPTLDPQHAHPKGFDGFDPERHRAELSAIIRAVEAIDVAPGALVDDEAMQAILRAHPRDGRGFFSRSQIIAGFRALAPLEGFRLAERDFVRRVQRRPVRSQSGVTPLTVLTKPFPCPGRCVFCPNDVRMPKSYLSDEPGAQRAALNRFDPYLQAWNRLAAYHAIGHPTDKIELIVLGGTWSFYPESYQVWFATRLFDALNDFGAEIDRRDAVIATAPIVEHLPAQLDGREHEEGRYNKIVRGVLGDAAGPVEERGDWAALAAAHRVNERAQCRSVGFVIETRPDHVTPEEVVRIRRLGCTKVQIGLQSLDDAVLAANKRGHDVASARRALALLRGAGFKLHCHWMPNLLGSTPEADRAGFDRLFDDPAFRPDELKLYPCSLIESAELMQHYERGEWRPYTHAELLDVLTHAISATPRSCRLTRVIRDISSDDIVVGNKRTNFREIAEREVARRGGRAQDIRAREIRGDLFDATELELRTTHYATSIGGERFLELVTPDDRIVGFLRLALPLRERCGEIAAVLPELAGAAIVRELHVYGAALDVGQGAAHEAQHRGFGRRLLAAARSAAHEAGYQKLAVISAIGTRDYYRKQGFADGELYQHLALGAGDRT